ncbi:MAG: butyrate kinase [Caldisericaceae bacterium]
MKILAINPGSTSTKIGLFDDEKPIFKESISHSAEELAKYSTSFEQKGFRTQKVLEILAERNVELKSIDAVIGRGGVLKPLKAGVYRVNEIMINDLKNSAVDHPSNIGAVIASDIANELGVPAYIADPVCVDEFEDIARVSGIKELERPTLSHALNTRATLFKYAAEAGKNAKDVNVVVAHLGGGISITPIKNGRMVDVSMANDGGPFSPERAGALPTTRLIKFAFKSGKSEKEIVDYITKRAGLISHLGTNDLRKVTEMINAGDSHAKLIFDAMCYQIAKEIGAMSTVLKGKVEAILLTGGMSYNEMLVNSIKERVSWIAPVKVYPGEEELEALAAAVVRVEKGIEQPREYV